MTLTTLRRGSHRLTADELLSQRAHAAVCKSFDRQAYYATELERGTITTSTDDGVMTQIIYDDYDDLKRRLALRKCERDAIEAVQRNMAWCYRLTVNAHQRATLRAFIAGLMQEIETREVRDQLDVAELCATLEAEATLKARSKRRQAEPLAKCRASNAPNGLSVNDYAPRHAAMQPIGANT